MSSSTIDEAIRLLELGYGDTERLKKIIETFNRSSMISMYDRKYVESLVTTYLVGNRRSPDKLPAESKNDLENVRKPSKTESASTFCDNCQSEVGESFKFCPSCGKPVSEISKQVEPETREVKDEPFVSYGKATHVSDDGEEVIGKSSSKKSREEQLKDYERDYLQRQNQSEYSSPTYEKLEKPVEKKIKNKGKKSNSKFIFIGIGVAVAVALGGVLFLSDSVFDISTLIAQSDTTPIVTCETEKQLVKSTKIDGFPDPDKDYQYYLNRYEEPSYQDWFHNSFPGYTLEEVLTVPTSAEAKTKIDGFPDPDKDYQYYLNRYENEPSYQDWFDDTFPGLTVYEAVC